MSGIKVIRKNDSGRSHNAVRNKKRMEVYESQTLLSTSLMEAILIEHRGVWERKTRAGEASDSCFAHRTIGWGCEIE